MACKQCMGTGCVTESGGEIARARLCQCVSSCEVCSGTGWSEEDKGGYLFTRRCPSCSPYRRAQDLFNKAGIPARFAETRLSEFMCEDAHHKAVLDYLEGYSSLAGPPVTQYGPEVEQGLMLMGPVGTGKTMLACATIRRLILEQRVECRFVDFFRLLAELRAGYSAGKGDDELIDPLVKVPVLVVDEMGKGRMDRARQDWELGILDQIISRRYNAKAPTIVTTNYYPSDLGQLPRRDNANPSLLFNSLEDIESIVFEGATLEDRVGARIYSRLLEMCIPIILYGVDYRTRMRKSL